MANDVIEQKVNYLLGLSDVDGDGMLDVVDYEAWVERLAGIRGWESGSEGHGRLESLFLDAFKGLQAAFGDDEGRVAIAPLRDVLVSMAEAGAPELETWADGYFRLIDADGDGFIGSDEYRDLMASVFVDGATADETFPRLDHDGDGRISHQEFIQLYLEFFTSDDPGAPGSQFWGPFS